MPSVAEFVCQAIERSGMADIQLVSLSTSARGEFGVSLTRPMSWLRGVRTHKGIWCGRPFTQVGVFASEFEFQRYQPRSALAKLLTACNLIQVVCGSPAWAWAVRELGKPVAVLCATRAIIERRRRDATARGLKAAWRSWMTGFTDRLDRKALQIVDAVQVMNPLMFSYAREVNPGREVIVRYTPPGVDVRRFQPAASRDPRLDPYILSVGRFSDPRKNVELLFESYVRLPGDVRETARLVLAGSTAPDLTFWARVRELGLIERVSFFAAPEPERLIDLYQSASVFALCSDEEGFGMVILEAMACGVPVVSTRSGGPDGIISDGYNGYLVDLDDADAIADRLARLLSDEALNRRLGDAARETILSRYEAGAAGKAFLETYDDLLSRRQH